MAGSTTTKCLNNTYDPGGGGGGGGFMPKISVILFLVIYAHWSCMRRDA